MDELARAVREALHRRRVELAGGAAVELGDEARGYGAEAGADLVADLALAAGVAEERERERLAERARLLELLVGLVQRGAGGGGAAADDGGRGGLDRAAAEHRHDPRLDLGRQAVGERVLAGAAAGARGGGGRGRRGGPRGGAAG